MEKKPVVGIIMGSDSDLPILKKALQKLQDFGIKYEVLVASAHRTPEEVKDWAQSAEDRGLKVIIAAAGMAAHLPGVVAAYTNLPVIGIPIDSSPLKGVDSLYAIVQMPPGVPVATVAINGGVNAAVLAAQIISLSDPDVYLKLKQMRTDFKYTVKKQNQAIQDELLGENIGDESDHYKIEYLKDAAGKIQNENSQQLPQTETEWKNNKINSSINIPEQDKKTKCQILRLDPQMPDPFEVEKLSDMLLEGGVIGIPTDTVYGIACDATSQLPVEKIYSMKKRDTQKALPIMVNNLKMLKRIVSEVPPKVERMLDDLWPGALTVVFKKSENVLKHVSQDKTIGVRIPENYFTLALLSMLNRPLAVTSANPSGGIPATSAKDLHAALGTELNLIVDTGDLKTSEVSTVLDVSVEPYRILREGVIKKDKLKEYLGDLLA